MYRYNKSSLEMCPLSESSPHPGICVTHMWCNLNEVYISIVYTHSSSEESFSAGDCDGV